MFSVLQLNVENLAQISLYIDESFFFLWPLIPRIKKSSLVDQKIKHGLNSQFLRLKDAYQLRLIVVFLSSTRHKGDKHVDVCLCVQLQKCKFRNQFILKRRLFTGSAWQRAFAYGVFDWDLQKEARISPRFEVEDREDA